MALDAPGGGGSAGCQLSDEPLEMGGGNQPFLGLPCQALPLLLDEQVCVCAKSLQLYPVVSRQL